MNTIEDFYSGADEYVALFNAFAAKHALVGRAGADHICYKCGSAESYEKIRAMFESNSKYIYQAIISRRRIAIIKLSKGIDTVLGPIEYVELSDQKPDNSQSDSYDHIEAFPIGQSYDEMVSEFESTERVEKVVRPHHTTHDIDIGGGFLFRCTQGLLIDKIRTSEMK